ncbi:MAG: hypothetical protein E7633_08930 [Ruminococcaceae bacterium]|nr:hypothetical protein [Oscillospiraceae bacterium]
MRDVRELKDDYLYEAGVTCLKSDDFYYVALGDMTTSGAGYVSFFSNEVGIKYKNLATSNSYVEDICNVIDKNSSEIAKADLVSIGYGSVTFMTDAITQFLNNKSISYDWSKYLDQETEAAFKNIIEVLKSNLGTAELGSVAGINDLPGAITAALEAYFYSCIMYMYYIPDAVEKIHKINPNATVALIGVYNPTRNITFDLGEGMSIDMNNYLDNLTDILATYMINSCNLSDNDIYIHAPDVSFKLTDYSLNMVDLMREFGRNKGANLAPSETGHKYIKDQMLKYISFTDKLIGDADGNGTIDSTDAAFVLQYDAELITSDKLDMNAADVNGDGEVNCIDALYILQYDAEIITKFPRK